MTRSTALVVSFCAWLLSCSLGYGLCLVVGIPYFWSVLPALCGAWLCFRRLHLPAEDMPDSRRGSRVACIMLLLGLLLVLDGALAGTGKHGHWDAWWFWNPRANYLTRPGLWSLAFGGDTFGTPFTCPVAHSDYPPFLPLLNAFSWSWLRMQPAVVPFLWNILALLLCCSVVFLELFPRNAVIAGLALFFLAQQQHFLELGAAQTADTWIALFLLLAIVSGNAAYETKNDKYWLTAGLALGCGIWMKNEGILIAAGFLLFSAGRLVRSGIARRYLAAGLVVPLAAWIAFKLAVAPANDIVSGAARDLRSKLTDAGRYADIWNLPREQIRLYYPALPWLLVSCGLAWLLIKARPSPYLPMLVFIWAGYAAIYLVSPHNLGWHINTSADRLLAHLYPGLIYILGLQLSKIRFSIDNVRPV